MRRHFLLAVILILILVPCTLSAAEGLFQINTIFQRASFPMFGAGGKDIIRYSAAGINLKSARGEGIHGVIDLSLLFPHKIEEKTYPATAFSTKALSSLPLALDGTIGLGYEFDLEPMAFFLSAGFHTGALLEGGSYLASFGVGIDLQNYVRLNDVLTAQIGLKFAVDFGGLQTFVSGSNQFAGFPLSGGIYTGLGINY